MATVTSIAGGAPKPVFDRLGPQFLERTGNRLNALYDSMSGIAARVAAREALDVLVMPVALIEGYVKDGIVQPEGRSPLANIGLAVGVTAGVPVPDVSTPEKLRPLAEASGGSVRRIGEAGGSAIHLPRLVAMRDSPVYAGGDYIGIRRTGASIARGIRLAPLAVGLFGLLVLLGALVAAWAWEGRRGKAG